MYFDYIFLLTDFYKNDFIPGSLESRSIIVPVDKRLWQERIYYFQKFYAASTTFCFGFFQADLGLENAKSSWIRDALSLYFFLPNYAKEGGAYLLVSDLGSGRDKEVMDTIEQVLESQGIAPLAKNYTVKDDHINYF